MLRCDACGCFTLNRCSKGCGVPYCDQKCQRRRSTSHRGLCRSRAPISISDDNLSIVFTDWSQQISQQIDEDEIRSQQRESRNNASICQHNRPRNDCRNYTCNQDRLQRARIIGYATYDDGSIEIQYDHIPNNNNNNEHEFVQNPEGRVAFLERLRDYREADFYERDRNRFVASQQQQQQQQPTLITVPNDEEFQHDVDAQENESECVICLTNKPVCMIDPCMHMVLCITCSIRLAKKKNQGDVKCPICNKYIKKIKRAYF